MTTYTEVTKDPHCIKIVHPDNIVLSAFIKQLEQIGPITQLHSLGNLNENSTRTLFCTFKEIKQAEEAKKVSKWNVIPYERFYGTRIFTPATTTSNRPLDTTRLYCKLLRNIEEERREIAFFEHFVEFGRLVYHEVVRDAKGYLMIGYVQYYNPEHAARAVKESDPRYGAQYAQCRKRPRDQQIDKMRYHWVCDEKVSESIYEAHDKTCTWQHQKKLREEKARKNFPKSVIRVVPKKPVRQRIGTIPERKPSISRNDQSIISHKNPEEVTKENEEPANTTDQKKEVLSKETNSIDQTKEEDDFILGIGEDEKRSLEDSSS